jgi:Family of unknown function (DUF5317)
MVWVLLLPLGVELAGVVSNQLVLIANSDKFPVMLNTHKMQSADVDGMIDDTHCVMTSETHLNGMADILDFKDAIYSIGDLFIAFGQWLWSFAPFVWGALVLRKLLA